MTAITEKRLAKMSSTTKAFATGRIAEIIDSRMIFRLCICLKSLTTRTTRTNRSRDSPGKVGTAMAVIDKATTTKSWGVLPGAEGRKKAHIVNPCALSGTNHMHAHTHARTHTHTHTHTHT